ncbi:MAG: hypothetical protein O3A37_10765 [Planctomycetota bacterium]|nr:hypothetical protein [Planctomycetota bacterium]
MRRVASPAGIGAAAPLLCFVLAVATVVAGQPAARADEPTVLGVVAVDGYADLKKQLGWLGGQVGQPGLAGIAESLLMVATQGQGLAGLDVTRPLGAVVTVANGMPIVHGYVPVNNLDKLLESLQGTLGPVERDGDARRVTLQNGIPLEFKEKATAGGAWAVTAIPGSPAGVDDPLPLLNQVVGPFSLGIRLFPSVMPEPLRQQLEMILEQAANSAGEQGQPIDPEAVRGFVTNLQDTESLALGLAIDPPGEQLFVEASSAQVAGSTAAATVAAAAQGTLTVGMPAAANAAKPAIRGHVAQSLPPELKAGITKSIDEALDKNADEPLAKSLGKAGRSLLAAMLEAGGIDAAVTVDTSPATAQSPLPHVTLGARIKDGKGLEATLKQLLGGGAALPAAMKVAFDTGTAGNATLHTITLDLADSPAAEQLGDTVDLTLAVAPEYAFVLAGGDVKARAAAALAASGKPDPSAGPIAGLQAALDGLFAYAAARGEGDEAEQAEQAAEAARKAGGGAVEVTVKPIERGVATRLAVDAAALKAAAAMAAAQQEGGFGGGGAVPLPQGFPIPLPVR